LVIIIDWQGIRDLAATIKVSGEFHLVAYHRDEVRSFLLSYGVDFALAMLSLA